MPLLHDPFKADVATYVHGALTQIAGSGSPAAVPTREEIYALLAVPPDFLLGQAALPCFAFAKALRQAPVKIASELAAKISEKMPPSISKVDAVNGYLNFHANAANLGVRLQTELRNRSYFGKQLLQSAEKEKIVVEYSQPNTHKAMHVGHLRCLVLGDAVCKVLAYVGHDVVKTTYPGDLGTHVAKSAWYVMQKLGGKLPEANRIAWLNDVYIKADEVLKAELGTPKEAENRTQLTSILSELQNRSGPHFDLWKETRDWSLADMRETYSWLGVNFDTWFYESECDKPSRELAQQKFKEGFFALSEGAVGIDLSAYKLGFAMYLKSDGNGLYLTKDLELIKRKFAIPGVTRSVVVVDARQTRHFDQLHKTAELMGYEQAKKSVCLTYETVNNEDGTPFSSRSGNAVGLKSLRTMMEQKVISDYLERYRGNWSDADIQATAEMVTIGALKYGMLKVDNNTPINFSLSEWLRLDGETGPYLQYVHARCQNILEKQGRSEPSNAFSLEAPQEQELLHFLGRFNEHALQAATSFRPSIMAGYLYDLSKHFNRFYEACPIRSAEGELRNSRLVLVEFTAEAIKRGLALLGIPAPNRM